MQRKEPIGLLLGRAARANARSFEAALETEGGTLPMWSILLCLHGRQPMLHAELARAVTLTGPTLTHHLDAMERRGLIDRVRPADNRRTQMTGLTADGEAMFGRLRSAAMSHDRKLRNGFSEEEIDSLRTLLEKLFTNL